MIEHRRSFLRQAGMAAIGLGIGAATNPWSALAHDANAGKVKIKGYKTLVVNNVPPYIGFKQWLFVQLFTDAGIIGIGERPTGFGRSVKPQIELIGDFCERYVVGRSPFDIEKIWLQAYAAAHDLRPPGLYGMPELSAIEMACWDLIGKATNQPVYNLLGGKFHEKLRAYSYLDMKGVLEKPELAGERAASLVERGIKVCKIDPFVPFTGGLDDFPLEKIRHVAKIFRAIRDGAGDQMEIGIGTHGQFSTSGAIRIAGILEEFNPMFFEEPVSPENIDEMARVAAHTRIPIATGERLVTKYQFSQVLEKQAAQIIQLDVGQCGGILESKKIAAMAEAHYATTAPHMFCGPVAASAAIQLDVCTPNLLVQEYNTTTMHNEIMSEPLQFENGYIVPPSKPGLGIELNEKVVKRQLVT